MPKTRLLSYMRFSVSVCLSVYAIELESDRNFLAFCCASDPEDFLFCAIQMCTFYY